MNGNWELQTNIWAAFAESCKQILQYHAEYTLCITNVYINFEIKENTGGMLSIRPLKLNPVKCIPYHICWRGLGQKVTAKNSVIPAS